MFNPIENMRQQSLNILLRRVILPISDRVFRQSMMERLRLLEKQQWWNKEQLHNRRDSDLKNLVKTAYQEVPFYRDLMDDADVRFESVNTVDDLRRLPIITKDMLRRDFPHQTTRETGYKTRVAHTSGSTGKNFQVLEDTYTTGWYRASFILALKWAGWRIGEPQLQTGMTLDRGFIKGMKDFFMRCHYVSAYNLTNDHLDTML